MIQREPLKVLIVDDEWIIRDGLKSFPWQEFDCQVVGEAEDGAEGMLHAKVLKPDIILSDIKMAGMDGLTFASEMKTLDPDVEIILLTGYDNFQFAQTAIKTGIYDYLLKPTNFQEMKQVISKLSEKIWKHRERIQRINDLSSKYAKSLPLLTGKLASDLLYGRMNGPEDMMRKLSLFDIRIESYIAISARLNTDSLKPEDDHLDDWMIDFGIDNICSELFSRSCTRVLSSPGRYAYDYLLLFPSSAQEFDTQALCMKICERIQKAVKDFVNTDICFGVSRLSHDTNRVNLAHQQASQACQRGYYFDRSSILFALDLESNGQTQIDLSDTTVDDLVEACLSHHQNESSRAWDSIQAQATKSQDIISFKAMLFRLVMATFRYLEKVNLISGPAQYDLLHRGLAAIENSSTIEDALTGVRAYVEASAEQNDQSCTNYHQEIIGKILEYIARQYSRDLSLDILSEEFKLSGAYISRLIRKHTGKSFMDILTDIRMEKARELILKGDAKIYEVAGCVGYHDLSYFSQVFKKKYGLSPKEYKILL